MMADQMIPVYWENFPEEEEKSQQHQEDIYNSGYLNKLIFHQERVEYFEVLNIVGSDDFYQLIISFLIGMVWFFSGLGLYSMPYIFQNPKFMCYDGLTSPPPPPIEMRYSNITSNNFNFNTYTNQDDQTYHHYLQKGQFGEQEIFQNNQMNNNKFEEQEGYECWENELACRRQIIIMNEKANQVNLSIITQFSLFCSHFPLKILVFFFFFAGAVAGLTTSSLYISNRVGQAMQLKIYLLFQSLNIFTLSYFDSEYILICSHLFLAGFLGFSIWSISQTYLRDICSRDFFTDYRCAIFFLNTISQMSATLLFTFITEWRKSLLYGVAIPFALLFLIISYLMIENPKFLIGRSTSTKVYKAFYDIFIFNDAKRFFSPRQFDIIYIKMIFTMKPQLIQNQVQQQGNMGEGQNVRRVIPLSSPSSSSNLSPSQINRNSNTHHLNLLTELNINNNNNMNIINTNNNNNNNEGNFRINTIDVNRVNTLDLNRVNTFDQNRLNTLDLNRLNTLDQNRLNTVSSPFQAQCSNIIISNKNAFQNQHQLAGELNQQSNPQNIHYQSQLMLTENMKLEEQISRKSNPFLSQNTSNNQIFQNRLEIQSFNQRNPNLADDKSIDKISLISVHNPTPEIMSNIFLKLPSNNQITQQNQQKHNQVQPNEEIQTSFSIIQNQALNNSSIQQKNYYPTQPNQQHENLQTQININNVQTEYISRSQLNLPQHDNNIINQINNNNNNTNNILITNVNNVNQLTTNNNTYQAFTHYINIRDESEEHKSQNEIISNVAVYRQNFENNVCEESENQQPINEKLLYQEYLKRLILYIIASAIFLGMYFLYMIEIDKIGINLSYNIFILGFSEFIGILFADKFIEFPDPRNTIKVCLFVSGVLSTSFVILKQTKQCEASHTTVCPEKIVQLLFIGLVRFSTIFGQSFLVRNFKLMESTTQIKEQTWKYTFGFGMIGAFIPLIILLITKSIYSTIFIFGLIAILISQFFRN